MHKKTILAPLCAAVLLTSPPPVYAGQPGRMLSAGGKCLDINGPDLHINGGKVQLWSCNTAPNQRWRFDDKGHLVNEAGKCLDVNGPDLNKNGGKVQIWDCNDSPNQRWTPDKKGRLVSAGGKCLDVNGPDLKTDGGKIQLWDCNDAPNQQWFFAVGDPNTTSPQATASTPAQTAPATETATRSVPAAGVQEEAASAQAASEPGTDSAAPAAATTETTAETTTEAATETTATVATTPSEETTSAPAVAESAMPATPPAKNEPAPFTGITEAHNEWRRKVGVPDLTWSDEIAAHAGEWAKELESRYGTEQFCSMKHRDIDRRYGENLAGGYTQTPIGVVNRWAGEIKDYNYEKNSCNAGAVCTHYTQVVWKTTTEVGCAQASCADGTNVWICNYNPPGNFIGQKPY